MPKKVKSHDADEPKSEGSSEAQEEKLPPSDNKAAGTSQGGSKPGAPNEAGQTISPSSSDGGLKGSANEESSNKSDSNLVQPPVPSTTSSTSTSSPLIPSTGSSEPNAQGSTEANTRRFPNTYAMLPRGAAMVPMEITLTTPSSGPSVPDTPESTLTNTGTTPTLSSSETVPEWPANTIHAVQSGKYLIDDVAEILSRAEAILSNNYNDPTMNSMNSVELTSYETDVCCLNPDITYQPVAASTIEVDDNISSMFPGLTVFPYVAPIVPYTQMNPGSVSIISKPEAIEQSTDKDDISCSSKQSGWSLSNEVGNVESMMETENSLPVRANSLSIPSVLPDPDFSNAEVPSGCDALGGATGRRPSQLFKNAVNPEIGTTSDPIPPLDQPSLMATEQSGLAASDALGGAAGRRPSQIFEFSVNPGINSVAERSPSNRNLKRTRKPSTPSPQGKMKRI